MKLTARVAQMKLILEASFHCGCRRLEDCERLIAAKNSCSVRPRPARVKASNL
jgi:hypothetical protein